MVSRTSSATPSGAEQELVRCRVGPGRALLPAAVSAIGAAADALDLPDGAAARLVASAAALTEDVARQGFDDPDAVVLELSLVARDGEILVRVDDQGLPRGLHDFELDAESAAGRLLRDHVADRFDVQPRGRDGNRAELAVRIRRADVRDAMDPSEHHARMEADPVPDDAKVSIRFMKPKDAEALARCVFHSYGYTYDADWVYQPDRIAAMLRDGELRSTIGVTEDGEVVGHFGLRRPGRDAGTGEGGQAVVDPRWRGHHLFTSLKRHMAGWAHRAGLEGIYSEATAAHPYSQKANLALGAHETGFLLGYIPATVGYSNLDAAPTGDRRSVALFYLKTNEGPARRVHAPERYRELVGRVLATSGLHGRLAPVPRGRVEGATSHGLAIHADHQSAEITVARVGRDLADVAGARLRSLSGRGIDCVYLDLPLQDPGTATETAALAEQGWFVGGIFPLRYGVGDVLRLQYLDGGVNVDPASISVASDWGRELLDAVVADHARADRSPRTSRSA